VERNCEGPSLFATIAMLVFAWFRSQPVRMDLSHLPTNEVVMVPSVALPPATPLISRFTVG